MTFKIIVYLCAVCVCESERVCMLCFLCVFFKHKQPTFLNYYWYEGNEIVELFIDLQRKIVFCR